MTARASTCRTFEATEHLLHAKCLALSLLIDHPVRSPKIQYLAPHDGWTKSYFAMQTEPFN